MKRHSVPTLLLLALCVLHLPAVAGQLCVNDLPSCTFCFDNGSHPDDGCNVCVNGCPSTCFSSPLVDNTTCQLCGLCSSGGCSGLDDGACPDTVNPCSFGACDDVDTCREKADNDLANCTAVNTSFCDECTKVNCTTADDCPIMDNLNIPGVNVSLSGETCLSGATTDGMCRYDFGLSLGLSCITSFPSMVQQEEECGRLLELSEFKDCMNPVGVFSFGCAGTQILCQYDLVCGSEPLDDCDDVDCTESCINIEDDCPIIDFTALDSNLTETRVTCSSSASGVPINTSLDVCTYVVALSAPAYTCSDEGLFTSDTMNETNVATCQAALPAEYEDCLDVVQVRCAPLSAVFQCVYQLVECDALDCDNCAPDPDCSGAGQGDCPSIGPAELPVNANVTDITCDSSGLCAYDIDFDLAFFNDTCPVTNTVINEQLLCQQQIHENLQDCKFRNNGLFGCAANILTCAYVLDCNPPLLDSCSDAACTNVNECLGLLGVTNCGILQFTDNATFQFDVDCDAGECRYRTFTPTNGTNCTLVYPNTTAACETLLATIDMDDCVALTDSGCRGLDDEEGLFCEFTQDMNCVAMANCSDLNPECVAECADTTNCPYLEFDNNTESLPSVPLDVCCQAETGGALQKCEYTVQYSGVNCTLVNTTSTGETLSTAIQRYKRCGQLIPNEYIGCLFATGIQEVTCTGGELVCRYRLRCGMESHCESGECAAFASDDCSSEDACTALPAVNPVGPDANGRWAGTRCFGSTCTYDVLFDFTLSASFDSCAINSTGGEQATYCTTQLMDYDGLGTDVTDCYSTLVGECMEPDCLNCLYQPNEVCDTCCPTCFNDSDCVEPVFNDPTGLFTLASKTCLNSGNETCQFAYNTTLACVNDTDAQATCNMHFQSSCHDESASTCDANLTTCVYTFACPDALTACDDIDCTNCTMDSDCPDLSGNFAGFNADFLNASAETCGAGAQTNNSCQQVMLFDLSLLGENCSTLTPGGLQERKYQCAERIPTNLRNCVIVDNFASGDTTCVGDLLQCPYLLVCGNTISDCDDATCVPTCSMTDDCPIVDFSTNPLGLDHTLKNLACVSFADSDLCDYAVVWKDSGCNATAGPATQAESDLKRCGQLIPDSMLGCLFVDPDSFGFSSGCNAIDPNLSDELECEYRLRCDLTELLGCLECFVDSTCQTADDCPTLDPVALAATGADRHTRSECLNNTCQLTLLREVANDTVCSGLDGNTTFCDLGLNVSNCLGAITATDAQCETSYDCLACEHRFNGPCDDDCCQKCNDPGACSTAAALLGVMIDETDTTADTTTCTSPFCVYRYVHSDWSGDCADLNETNAFCDSKILPPYEDCVMGQSSSCAMGFLIICDFAVTCDHPVFDNCTNCVESCTENLDCPILDFALLPDAAWVVNSGFCATGDCVLAVSVFLEEGPVPGVTACTNLTTDADERQACSDVLPADIQPCTHVMSTSCVAILKGNLLSCEYGYECNATDIETSCFDPNCTVTACASALDCPEYQMLLNDTDLVGINCAAPTCEYQYEYSALNCSALSSDERAVECNNLLVFSGFSKCMVSTTNDCDPATGERLMCNYDLLDECVAADCDDIDCVTNCMDPVTECAVLDFLDNPFLEPVESIIVACAGNGACQYRVTFETQNSSLFAGSSEIFKFCSAQIPLDYTGCLYLASIILGPTFSCRYHLLCELSAFQCPCEYHAECADSFDCPELPALTDLGTEGMGRVTRTLCLAGTCRYESLYEFNNISSISTCNGTETAQEDFCEAQLSNFDGMGLDLSTCLELDTFPTLCLDDPYDCLACDYREINQCEGCCDKCNNVSDCANITHIDGLVISSVDTVPVEVNCEAPFCAYEFVVSDAGIDCSNSTSVFATCDSFVLAPFDSCVQATFYTLCADNTDVVCVYTAQCNYDVLADCDNCSRACAENLDCEILDESLYPDNSILFNLANCDGGLCGLAVSYAFDSGVVEGNCSSLNEAERQYQCSQALLPVGLTDCMHVLSTNCQPGANVQPEYLQCAYVQECNATEIKTSCFGSCIGTNCSVESDCPTIGIPLADTDLIAKSCAGDTCEYSYSHDPAALNCSALSDNDRQAKCESLVANTGLCHCLDFANDSCVDEAFICEYVLKTTCDIDCLDCCPECNVDADCPEASLTGVFSEPHTQNTPACQNNSCAYVIAKSEVGVCGDPVTQCGTYLVDSNDTCVDLANSSCVTTATADYTCDYQIACLFVSCPHPW